MKTLVQLKTAREIMNKQINSLRINRKHRYKLNVTLKREFNRLELKSVDLDATLALVIKELSEINFIKIPAETTLLVLQKYNNDILQRFKEVAGTTKLLEVGEDEVLYWTNVHEMSTEPIFTQHSNEPQNILSAINSKVEARNPKDFIAQAPVEK